MEKGNSDNRMKVSAGKNISIKARTEFPTAVRKKKTATDLFTERGPAMRTSPKALSKVIIMADHMDLKKDTFKVNPNKKVSKITASTPYIAGGIQDFIKKLFASKTRIAGRFF
ncbi:MAG: hypothetical protein K6U80_02855 [Firmicutes bacterium]|nr:hypothetical protein [Bacillota bacterium]